MNRTFFKYLAVLIVIWLVYSGLNIFAPSPETVSRYGLTLFQTQLLRITILLPMLFIWTTALFSVIRFWRYTKLLKDSEETFAFRKITLGLLMLLLVIMVPSIINSVASYFPDSVSVQKGSIILRNYTSVVLYFIGFWSIWQGSKNLVKNVNASDLIAKFRTKVIGLIAILGVVYVWLIFQNSYRSASDDAIVKATYYLPDILIILTIIIPYVLIWILGSLAILNLWAYAKRVQGIIYRETFASVAYGFTFTIVLLIVLQFLSQANASLGYAALSIILVIIYLLLLAIAAGYLLVARGARKLTVIEEVE